MDGSAPAALNTAGWEYTCYALPKSLTHVLSLLCSGLPAPKLARTTQPTSYSREISAFYQALTWILGSLALLESGRMTINIITESAQLDRVIKHDVHPILSQASQPFYSAGAGTSQLL